MKLLIFIALLFSGCQTPDPVAMQNYLNYLQRAQQHRDIMKSTNRLQYRPVIQQQRTVNPYDPMQMHLNPYAPMMGY